MSTRMLHLVPHRAALKRPFTISRGSKTHAETVRVRLEGAGGAFGRGESVPYGRYGESVAGVMAAIEAVRPAIEAGCSRADLLALLPAGAARCALDCALWDLEAKALNRPVWQLMELAAPPEPVETAETVSLDTPAAMAAAARAAGGGLLKLKIGGAGDMARVAAVHAARPDARLILDANEALAPEELPALADAAAGLGVVLIEQPLAAGADGALRRGALPVPVCADESVHEASDIAALSARYDAVNVKLDKAGGLTGALALVAAARAEGMGVMVGCMVAGSLSLAPAVLAAQLADLADLDGPLWLAADAPGGLACRRGHVWPPEPAFWGGPARAQDGA